MHPSKFNHKRNSTTYLQKEMARYYKWRKSVLMLMPLELALLIIVFCLFIVTFIVSLTSSKGTDARSSLKDHLSLLKLRFNNSAAIDAEVERNGLEKLLNNVKTACTRNFISSDKDLKAMLHYAYEQISTIACSRADESKTSWIKLKAVTYGFGEFYFPGFIK